MNSTTLIRILTIGLLGIAITTAIILFLIPDSPAQAYMLDFMFWLKNIPKEWGSVVLSAMYGVGLIFCFPGTPFNLAAGFLFGIWLGNLVSITGCIAGATFAFLIGRTLARDWAQQQMMKHKNFVAVNIAVEKNGWLIIFLIRLSPILPFGICNYLFGVSKVRFWVYWSATFAGLLPCTIAYTYLGSLMRSLTDMFADDGEDRTDQTILITASVAITVLGIVVITAVTKRTLDKTLRENTEKDSLLELESTKLPGSPKSLSV